MITIFKCRSSVFLWPPLTLDILKTIFLFDWLIDWFVGIFCLPTHWQSSLDFLVFFLKMQTELCPLPVKLDCVSRGHISMFCFYPCSRKTSLFIQADLLTHLLDLGCRGVAWFWAFKGWFSKSDNFSWPPKALRADSQNVARGQSSSVS